MQDMQTALRSISLAGGYHHEISNMAVKLDPDHAVEELIGETAYRPFLVLEPQPDTYEYFPAKQIRMLLPFLVHAVNESDTTKDDDLQKTFFRLCADVEQALAADISRAGNATDTRIFQREIRQIDGKMVWAVLSGEVRLNRTYGVPNA